MTKEEFDTLARTCSKMRMLLFHQWKAGIANPAAKAAFSSLYDFASTIDKQIGYCRRYIDDRPSSEVLLHMEDVNGQQRILKLN